MHNQMFGHLEAVPQLAPSAFSGLASQEVVATVRWLQGASVNEVEESRSNGPIAITVVRENFLESNGDSSSAGRNLESRDARAPGSP